MAFPLRFKIRLFYFFHILGSKGTPQAQGEKAQYIQIQLCFVQVFCIIYNNIIYHNG
jgi:hypothetical protein